MKVCSKPNVYFHHFAPEGNLSVSPINNSVQFSSVSQSCRLFVTPWTEAHQASLSITNSRSLLKLMSIVSMMPSNNPILCCPLLLPPSVFHSIRDFSTESVLCIRWPKDWSFGLSIRPSNEYSELISLRIDWLDLLAVQGTLKLTLICYTPIQNKKFKKRMGMFEKERAETSEL